MAFKHNEPPSARQRMITIGSAEWDYLYEAGLLSEAFAKIDPDHHAQWLQRLRKRAREGTQPPAVPTKAIEDLDGYALKPDPLSAQTPTEFVELMKQYRIWAGEPSYREIVRRARNAFGASTLCQALKSTALPPEKLVRAFIWACSGSETDLQAWVTAWRTLRMKHTRAKNEVLAPVTTLSLAGQQTG